MPCVWHATAEILTSATGEGAEIKEGYRMVFNTSRQEFSKRPALGEKYCPFRI